MDTKWLRDFLLRAFDEDGFVASWTDEELAMALATIGSYPGLAEEELLSCVPRAHVGADGTLQLKTPRKRKRSVKMDRIPVEEYVKEQRAIQVKVQKRLHIEVAGLLVELGVPEAIAQTMSSRRYDEALAVVGMLRFLRTRHPRAGAKTKKSLKSLPAKTRETVCDKEAGQGDEDPG